MPKALLDLAPELLILILKHTALKEDTYKAAITTGEYSRACKTLYWVSRRQRAEQIAGKLLLYVLRGDEQNALRMLRANCYSLFLPATQKAYAEGFNETVTPQGEVVYNAIPEIISSTPFKAALAAGDWWMLKKIVPFFNTLDISQLAVMQLAQQFPNGFLYPPSEYDFNAIAEAMTNGRDDTIRSILIQFRKDMIQNLSITGYRFNLNHWLKACEVLDQHYQGWSHEKRSHFFYKVVGYLQGLLAAVDVQAISQGLMNVQNQVNYNRSFKIWNYDRTVRFSIFPLDANPTYRLGKDYAIDIQPASSHQTGYNPLVTSRAIENYIKLKERLMTEFAAELRAYTQSQETPTQVVVTQESTEEQSESEVSGPPRKKACRT